MYSCKQKGAFDCVRRSLDQSLGTQVTKEEAARLEDNVSLKERRQIQNLLAPSLRVSRTLKLDSETYEDLERYGQQKALELLRDSSD